MGQGLKRAFAATRPDLYRPCKLGTQPARARVHAADKIEVGKWIRIQECQGDKWHKVLVTYKDLHSDYFAASR